MEFRASRLRVQIPCGDSGSVFDLGAGCTDSPQTAFCPLPPPISHPTPPPPPVTIPCEPSHFLLLGDPFEYLRNPHQRGPRRVVLAPEDLAAHREHLELRLQAIKLAEESAAVARRQVEADLEDVTRATEALNRHQT